MSTASRVLLDLDRPKKWPAPLLCYLDAQHDLFLDWKTEQSWVTGPRYDEAINGLVDALQPYEIMGWHCTRLTDMEIEEILRNGMQLPDATMLARRIDALVKANQITSDVARCLKSDNQADEENRAGKVWFCFFPPRTAGEDGIERFFRYWGGEALYNSHENDQATSSVISRIGIPCIVEANVPIASLEMYTILAYRIVRRFLISNGYDPREPTDHEDCINCPLPAENIRRIIRFPNPDFLSLTGCSDWHRPLT